MVRLGLTIFDFQAETPDKLKFTRSNLVGIQKRLASQHSGVAPFSARNKSQQETR